MERSPSIPLSKLRISTPSIGALSFKVKAIFFSILKVIQSEITAPIKITGSLSGEGKELG